jgi:hypothetical protein
VFRRWWVPRLAGVRSRLAVLAAATHANELVAAVAACNLRLGSCTAMTKLRIVILAKVWHLMTGNGPCTMDKSKTPPTHLGSCRYLTLYRGGLDLSIIR